MTSFIKHVYDNDYKTSLWQRLQNPLITYKTCLCNAYKTRIGQRLQNTLITTYIKHVYDDDHKTRLRRL